MPINADKVMKRSGKKKLKKKFEDRADLIIECLKDCVDKGITSPDLGACVKECLTTQKNFEESDADEAVSLMGFITVG
jgi:hypothetical protein